MPREEKGQRAKGERSTNKDFCRAPGRTFYNLGLSGNRTTAGRAPSADSRTGWKTISWKVTGKQLEWTAPEGPATMRFSELLQTPLELVYIFGLNNTTGY